MEGFIGPRIIIRKARLSDLDAIYENIYSDTQLLSTMFLQPSYSLEQAAARLRRTIDFQRDKLLFFVTLRQTDEAIGLCGLREERPGIWSEAGLAIARKYQRQGYAREMLGILMHYAFVQRNAEEFAYYTIDTNTASKNLAKSFGFHYCDTRPEVRQWDGKVLQIERYSLSREEYLKNQ